eukprot:CAMPEP_0183310896 /NCGR_PEP_ID=MMETSP0160_2-20130417/33912_1 /TAXON_ID=2839 ORGANISM="Odontella Sinensis, Strain Grunow 1884" /NCGR_SAMPLE_ID=MMETSP0160_2 /ASSEMBLY_ACC=CAM_ASM_000250 /LENGTH=431 /DNA_ID=CAMNT_0025475301 /DNA_START=97 /DNA_END=1392 /DNA_ORIENTATION=+
MREDTSPLLLEDGLGTTAGAVVAATAGESLSIPSASDAGTGAAKKRIKKKTKEGSSTSTSGRKKSGEDGVKKKRKKRKESAEGERERLIKYGSLLLLVAQMVGLVLLMRYTRTRKGGDMYLASTAVFVMEVMKFIICLCVIFYQSGSTLAGLMGELRRDVIESPGEVLKLCVPSLLYTIQNNLLYLALTNLDAATYQVLYQLKILTTALFSAAMLQRRFSALKWLSLVILTVGVAIVQTSGSGDAHHAAEAEDKSARMRFVGLVAVLCATCTSGFSGVYFEKILKGSSTGLWMRNIQMGLPSIIIAYITVYVEDSKTVAERGFFSGYTSMVWTVVTVQAVGGLIVAVVVKYADNVLKVFAASFSIVVSSIISAFIFDFRPNLQFLLGTALVMTSTVMYGRPEKKRRKKAVLPMTMTVERGSSGARKSSLVM